jgi:hypothetical protein
VGSTSVLTAGFLYLILVMLPIRLYHALASNSQRVAETPKKLPRLVVNFADP